MSSHSAVGKVLRGYREGVFPMADPDSGKITLFSCDPRCIVPLEPGGLKISQSLERVYRQGKFKVVVNADFSRVISECAVDRSEENRSWISSELAQLYIALHRLGHAHSVEARLGEELVGGLYGVAIGGAFFGESMFSRPALGGRDASKVCLVSLVVRLRACGFTLLDCQYSNSHMLSMGAIEIPASEYHRKLSSALDRADAKPFA